MDAFWEKFMAELSSPGLWAAALVAQVIIQTVLHVVKSKKE